LALNGEILIQYATERDADGILAIETDCFSLPHTKDQLIREIGSEQSVILVAKEKNNTKDAKENNINDIIETVAGFVTMQYVLDEGYIGDVAVAAAYRRRGIADLLLQRLKQEGESRNLSFITLEVRESNAPAIALYEKNGYRKVSVMKDYYTLPKENAVIMTLRKAQT